MKILVAHPLHSQLVESGLGDFVSYRPELADQSEEALRSTLIEQPPDGVLVDGDAPSKATLAAWKEVAERSTVQLVHRRDDTGSGEAELPGVAVERAQGEPGDLTQDVKALGLIERGLMRHGAAERLSGCGISTNGRSALAGSKVTLVGAGIVNLITACDLVEHGASIDVLDAAPDPRSKPPWQRLGATHGGENARMFCFTEADNYNEKTNVVYSGMDEVFRRRISEGGWMGLPLSRLDDQERQWIRDFDRLPRWRAEVFNADIHGFNISSAPLWQRLQTQHAHLFDDVGLVRDVLRIYRQPEKVAAAQALHGRIGSLLRALDPQELSSRHPALADAVAAGEIAGGLEIRGFTLNIHDFVEKLLGHLEQRGVRFHWNRRVTAVERDSESHICGLRTEDGIVRSEHYVISPGAYGKTLLEGTRSQGKIQGILGLWMLLPNLEPRLRNSIKIHREGHVGEDSNVTIASDNQGRPILILGSGYGFIGSKSLDMESPEIDRLFEALEHTARRYFPKAYQQAKATGTLMGNRKACVRPFTSTGLGIFEVDRTAEGGRFIITSGHNTGGFTQAPVVGEAVATTLGGSSHSMQSLYEPERGLTP